ncbi:ATP-binding protein [Terasakiella pusilla]|uniref:hybrid sensor histidine kinase/response regulator n=1 Tax=Terasakiella pusilla TaxID=64973 RepID=UPI003AA94BBC
MQDQKFRILKSNRPPIIRYILVSIGIVALALAMLFANFANEVRNRNTLNDVYARMIEESITRTLESVENSLFPILMELNEDENSPVNLHLLEKKIRNLIFFAPHIRQLIVLKNNIAVYDTNRTAKGVPDLSHLDFPERKNNHYSVSLTIGKTTQGRFLPIEGEDIPTNSHRQLIPVKLERQFLNRIGAYSFIVALNASHIERMFQRLDLNQLDGYNLLALDGTSMLLGEHHYEEAFIQSTLEKVLQQGRDEITAVDYSYKIPMRHAAIRLSSKYPLAVVIASEHHETAAVWFDDNRQLIFALCSATLLIVAAAFFLLMDYHRNRRLRKEVQLLSTAVHQSPVTILITDKHGTIEYANTALKDVYGYDPEDWIGRTPAILKSGLSDEKLYNTLWSHVRKGMPWQGEFINKTKSGKLVPTTTAVSPVIDEDGNFTHIVGIIADITAQKQLQEKAQEASRQARKANEAKSNFLATMSHELRTPMTGIRGIINLLRTQDVGPQETKNFLEDLDKSSNALLLLLNDILDLSKIEAGKLQIESRPCNPAEIIKTVLHLFKDAADTKNIVLTTNADTCKDEWVLCDTLRLRQIVSNLLSNAVKFTEVGQVDAHMEVVHKNDKTSLISIQIIDTGIGMTPDQTKNIFEPFTQADSSTTRKYGGTGLGLTITKQLCELLGGTISLESQHGVGTTFSVSIPLPTASAPAAEENDQSTLRALNILLAEDNAINRKVLSTTLRQKGNTVDSAENGKVAVSHAAQRRYDLILMDMQMPEMDGMDATKVIRASSPYNQNTPIIALTADAFPEHHKRFKELGINDVITKPVKWDTFESTIKRHLK